jgi:Cd2+/Zn2+-exporting ATPase
LFEKFGQDLQGDSQVERLRKEGKTVVLVGARESVAGLIAVRDEIRSESREVIEKLHRMGIKVFILTGDNETTARAIAEELGVNDVRADLTPGDKIKSLIEIERRYGKTAMVGDGINDAPALARATVGIAMGGAGTDAAIEAADTALMADDLNKVSFAITLGKKVWNISRQNIIFSLLILAILIPSALTGILSVAMAVLFHEASELIAVVNGLRAAKE